MKKSEQSKKPNNFIAHTDDNGIFRGWTVAACCFCMTLTYGLINSYSVFFLPLASTFGWNHTIDSTIVATGLVVSSFGSLIGGLLASRIGFRKLCYTGSLLIGFGLLLSAQIQTFIELLLLYGVITSFGIALVAIAATSLIVKWFVKKRGIAVGIAAAGSGFGTLAIPPLGAFLIAIGSWRIAFLALGAGFSLLLLTASYFMQTPEDRSTKPYGWDEINQGQKDRLKEYEIRKAMSTREFWMIYTMFLLCTFGSTMFLIHAAPFAKTYAIDPVTTSFAVGTYGAGSLVARVTIGALGDRVARGGGIIISLGSELFSLAALPFVAGYIPAFFVCAFGIGFGFGGYLSDFIATTGDLFGMNSVQGILGIIETAFGIGGLIGPIVAGAYFDSLQNYTGIFEIGAVAVLVAFIISIQFSKSLKVFNYQRF